MGASAMAASLPWLKAAADPPQAMISISLDLEMARHYPTWEHTHWEYEKGIWTKTLRSTAVRAAETVRGTSGVIHFFVVGRVLSRRMRLAEPNCCGGASGRRSHPRPCQHPGSKTRIAPATIPALSLADPCRNAAGSHCGQRSNDHAGSEGASRNRARGIPGSRRISEWLSRLSRDSGDPAATGIRLDQYQVHAAFGGWTPSQDPYIGQVHRSLFRR